MAAARRTFELLLVEDNPADVAVTKAGLTAAGHSETHIHVVADGAAAEEYLKQSPQIDLILLDLNLPKRSGHEVLRTVRGDPKHRNTPVIMVSSSDEPSDVRESYDSGANSYVVKPSSFKEYVQKIRDLEAYWFETARLP